MASHPANLALRFILEVTALVGLGWWGASLGRGWLGVVLAILLPAGAATAWGTFAVPDDPSRSGKAPVAVPGRVRLVMELAVLGLGVVGFSLADLPAVALALLALVALHYSLSLDRIRWLLDTR